MTMKRLCMKYVTWSFNVWYFKNMSWNNENANSDQIKCLDIRTLWCQIVYLYLVRKCQHISKIIIIIFTYFIWWCFCYSIKRYLINRIKANMQILFIYLQNKSSKGSCCPALTHCKKKFRHENIVKIMSCNFSLKMWHFMLFTVLL